MKDFLEKLAGKNPTPGGGAAAAIAGAMGAALVEMVISLSKNLELKTNNLREKLLKLAEEDVVAFDSVMAAYRSKNKEKIMKALLKAIEVPEKTKKLSKEVEKLAKIAARKGNKNALSDAKTALYLAQAAQKGAEANIKINKQSLASLRVVRPH
ncbi:MAG: Formiminotransferase-cyclodeaminase [Candidatus Woesebacteria bacterium GW2011_GWB1_41_10]|uniref:Formiminotransferase-cyclodeaminase n=1 Tax=Candidatus Woesebacteria bacterium GW2011_GWB1_41_10 TaxID=1618577 RepID=A0A0G0XDG5_9BACT|nr:MAG: Formiminotransferase-cyclodeaminase [Candidatus Woesebacteria bacterium GW2011_GWB1_41_10]